MLEHCCRKEFLCFSERKKKKNGETKNLKEKKERGYVNGCNSLSATRIKEN